MCGMSIASPGLMAARAGGKAFRILVATDGSPAARAAMETALAFPWPEPSIARAVVALGGWPRTRRGLRTQAARVLHAEVEPAQRLLARRWGDAAAVALHEAPADAIFSEAHRFNAQVIVVGWRGHGAVRRLLAGSVSREVVERAHIPVLVARSALSDVRRLVIGFDASAGARAAVSFASRLEHRRGRHAVLLSVLEPLPAPLALRRLPASIRAELLSEVAAFNREQAATARRKAHDAAQVLKGSGWAVRIDMRTGFALDTLLGAAEEHDNTVLIVGARAKRGMERALLGSVAEGAVNHSRVPVLIVP
jgi:nucleotide-binding universal stress UspA family protein